MNATNQAYAYGLPAVSGLIRKSHSDFQVKEQLAYDLQGEGEHIYLLIEKSGENTQRVADDLAKFAGIKAIDIGYAGLKDRHAITQQWFSIRWPQRDELNWIDFAKDSTKVLKVIKHNKKLKRGNIKANHFKLVIRDITGDIEQLKNRLDTVQQYGVPNYFGEQRFGINAGNLANAERFFRNKTKVSRSKRSLYISAARSHIFNRLLSLRIEQGIWNRVTEGDVLVLGTSNSIFTVESSEMGDIQQRLDIGEISITGPLYGQGDSLASARAHVLEQQVFDDNTELVAGLFNVKAKTLRRALRVIPQNLHYDIDGSVLRLQFALPAGCYATSVLRELIDYESRPH